MQCGKNNSMSRISRIFNNKFFKETSITILDQGLLSATNFTINLLLIRNTAPNEYGLYALAFSTILLFIGVQNAIVTTPMTVLGPKKNERDRARFVGELLPGQYVIWLPMLLLALIFSELLLRFGFDDFEVAVVRIICFTVFFVLLREFFRRVFFLYLLPQFVLLLDFIYAVTFIGGVLLAITVFKISAITALSAMSTACFLLVPVALATGKKKLTLQIRFRPGVLRETWVHGKFALMGVIFTWIHNRAFLFLLSGIKDNAAVADIDSIRLVFMPVQIVMTSISAILKPRGAAILATGNKRRFFKIASIYMLLTCTAAIIYIIGMLLSFNFFSLSLFKREIANSAEILVLWGVKFGLQACMLILTVSYQVLEQFKQLFKIGAIAACVSIFSTYYGIGFLGAPGSLFGPIAGEICYILLLLYFARREISKGIQTFDIRA